MKALRRSGLIAIALLLSVLLVACGEAATQGTTASTSNQGMNNNDAMNNQKNSGAMYASPTTSAHGMMNATPTASSTMNTNNNSDMMGGITITADMGGDAMAFIHTGKATINGQEVNVLMTNKGFAVYYYRSDTPFTATCTGACAQSWPPILAPKGIMTISSSMPLPKQLSVHQTPNGAQVFYDGHALYTYAADMQAGIATGRGQDNLWYLVGFLL